MTSNLLVIMSDEHQARALGCAGHFAQTPHLDRLAAGGLRFTNAYTPSPICVPARAAFATGRYVHETRLWDNAMPYDGSIPGWGHALQAAGVPVESIGKLHYRAEEDPAGFDIEHLPMMVVDGVGMVWASIRREDERIHGPARMLGGYIGPGESNYTAYDAAVTDRTCQWLRDRSGPEPWCLYVGLVAPHFPLVVPEPYYALYPEATHPAPKLHPDDGHRRHPWVERQNAVMDSEAMFENAEERVRAVASYYGLVSWLDHNIGRILAALDAAGLTENTTIVYTSDHGDNVGARGLWGKSNLYEESAAVPLIMSGPDVAPGVCETPVTLLDLSAEIARHFGTELDASSRRETVVRHRRRPRSGPGCFLRVSRGRCRVRGLHGSKGALEAQPLRGLCTRAFRPLGGSRGDNEPRRRSGARRDTCCIAGGAQGDLRPRSGRCAGVFRSGGPDRPAWRA